jgi:hypothetical protein
LAFAVLAVLIGMVVPAPAAQFEFHGDLNNRFLIYTNHHDWLNSEQTGSIEDKTVSSTYGELKYRFWFEAADDNNNIKGVYAIEIGGVRFGRAGTGRSEGGSYSGDGANVETRWAYLDFQTPGIDAKARWRMGLFGWDINPYLWSETATGISLNGSAGDLFDYQLGWIRTVDRLPRSSDANELQDVDNFLGRVNFKPVDKLTIGLFGLWVTGDGDRGSANAATLTPRNYLLKQFASNARLNYVNIGLDGTYAIGNFFFNWDLIYQTGKIEDVRFDDSEFSGLTSAGTDFDLRAYFIHADAGYKMNKHKFTYTFWYASGDDNPRDGDFRGFLAVDLDRDDNLSLFEGLYADDASYFTERPYILDKGFIMNKLGWEYKWTEKLTVGAAAMYMMTAEDIKYVDGRGRNQSENAIGIEANAFFKYMIFKNVELAVNAGYLFAGDAMDAFERGGSKDGKADEDIFGSSARIRYRF